MKSYKLWLKVIPWVIFIGLLPLAWWKANAIEDWVKLFHYTPPVAVVNVANQDSMTGTASHLFYINKPKIEDNIAAFRADCTESEQTIVLGCYHQGESGISIYNVSDIRLQGVVQVTAAHEMLHAAYERLSPGDRQMVDQLLQNYYDHDLHDQRIIDTINSYKKTEPRDLLNEMHSIFGTELRTLPTDLENYYKRYFVNRGQVVGYAEAYQGEFTSKISQIDAYDNQLTALKDKITAEEESLTSQLAKINSDRTHLDDLKNANNISEYNQQVPVFNREIDAYNSGVSKLKADIAYYNQIVSTRNTLASELKSLDSAIDTRLDTQVTQ